MDTNKIVQEAYDAVIKQGGPSMGRGGCRYRGEGGRKCIIGHMITDKHYNKSMEASGVEYVMEYFSIPTLKAFSLRVHVLKELQAAHDRSTWDIGFGGRRSDAEFLVIFKERMAKLSLRFNLGLKV